jgi:hypothetical protein
MITNIKQANVELNRLRKERGVAQPWKTFVSASAAHTEIERLRSLPIAQGASAAPAPAAGAAPQGASRFEQYKALETSDPKAAARFWAAHQEEILGNVVEARAGISLFDQYKNLEASNPKAARAFWAKHETEILAGK